MNVAEGRSRQQTEPFGYPIVLANSFDEVLDRARVEANSVDIGGFAQILRRSACTLLQARGGAGKTYTANRLCEIMRQQGVWSVTVPAVSLSAGDSVSTWVPGQWAEAADDHEAANRADAGEPGFIIVDGLNEVDRGTGDAILEAIGPVTAMNPQISFMITDRLVRRHGASPFWKHATLGPVPEAMIRKIARTEPTRALSIPFYLKRHSSGSAADEILLESISRFVQPQQLQRLARAAYESYVKHSRRTIDRTLVEAAVGRDVWVAMLEAGAVIPVPPARQISGGDTDYLFEHHLLHDFLAGCHLATRADLWGAKAFDVVTLKASSFDALALALAQVQSETDVEDLVQRVYDWNFYAAAYMLEEDRGGGRRVSECLQIALLGALAEKRFDDVVPTVVRVEDALRVQQSSLAHELLSADSRRQIIENLEKRLPSQSPTWFNEWFDRFNRADGTPATAEDIVTLTEGAPMVGWGAANAIRRFVLSPNEAKKLRDLLLEHDSPTIRWRAAHALGPHPSTENLHALTKSLMIESEKSWVAYGALRARFEQIRGMPPEDRPKLLSEMAADTHDTLAIPGPLRSEMIRCLDVDPLPKRWHRDIEPLLNRLWDTADARGAVLLADLAERLRKRKAVADVVC